jgi:hypothetical protein
MARGDRNVAPSWSIGEKYRYLTLNLERLHHGIRVRGRGGVAVGAWGHPYEVNAKYQAKNAGGNGKKR